MNIHFRTHRSKGSGRFPWWLILAAFWLATVFPQASAVAQAAPAPLVYFLLDTARPSDVKLGDHQNIKAIMALASKANPATKFYMHLTNIKITFDGFLVDPENKRKLEFILDGYRNTDAVRSEAKMTRNISEELSLMSTNILQLKGKGLIDGQAPVWIVAFHDMDLVDPPRADSRCCALTDGWLSAPQSPFIRNFLSKDNAVLKGARSVVFLSHPVPLAVRRAKEQFTAQLFDKVGATLHYLGYNYAYPTDAVAFTGALMEAFSNGQLSILNHEGPRNATVLQMVDEHGNIFNVDRYN
ncbi:hypothetical protein [Azospirillum sp. B506]|uniref:hypothetical protein n=1 Tax=Azospirillum sp. B506 TaxID=137721 RepID=UPI0005B268DC|nr:hypothetical protein [Azospirillum sp. B506]